MRSPLSADPDRPGNDTSSQSLIQPVMIRGTGVFVAFLSSSFAILNEVCTRRNALKSRCLGFRIGSFFTTRLYLGVSKNQKPLFFNENQGINALGMAKLELRTR